MSRHLTPLRVVVACVVLLAANAAMSACAEKEDGVKPADCGEISAPCEGALMAFDGGPRPRCVVGDAHAERLANDPAFLAEVIACERRLADGEPLAGLTAEEFKARYLTEVEQ